MKFSYFAFFLALASTGQADPEVVSSASLLSSTLTRLKEAPVGRLYEDEDSPMPSGAQVVYCKRSADAGKEVWLRESKSGQMIRLYEYDRSAKAMLSPNGRYVVIVDRYASNASEVVILVKDKVFRRIKNPNIPVKGLQLLARIYGLKSLPHIDHLYCNVPTEPDDVGQFKVVIWGYESGKQELEHWFFIYDIRSGKAFVSNESEARKAGSPLVPINKT